MSEPPPKLTRTRKLERVLLEAFLVALAGAFVLGVFWEVGFLDIGWFFAIAIWVCGAPLLEIIRMRSSRD